MLIWQFVDYAHSHGHEIDGNRNDPKQSFTFLDEQARAIGKKANLNQTKLDACDRQAG